MSEAVLSQESDGIAAEEWRELLARVSNDGQLFFTENQLYLAYARNRLQVTRYIARRGVIGLFLIVVGLAAWVYALKADWGITLVLGIFITLSGVAMVGTGVVTRREPASRERVNRWLSKQVQSSPLERLIEAPRLAETSGEHQPAHVACLIIVQRKTLADLLLLNGAHQQLSALIVAESGYPRAHLAQAQRLLNESSDLSVLVLHDATPEGVALAARLQKNADFPLGARKLLDVGLFPADVQWLAELAPAIPNGYTNQVPVDSLSYRALVAGLGGVTRGALSLVQGIEAAEANE